MFQQAPYNAASVSFNTSLTVSLNNLPTTGDLGCAPTTTRSASQRRAKAGTASAGRPTTYPVSIRDEIEKRTGRNVARAAVFITLERLEQEPSRSAWFRVVADAHAAG